MSFSSHELHRASSRQLPATKGDSADSPKEFCGHTFAEWGKFILDMGPISMVVIAFTGGECSAIPSLKAFILCFGVVTLLTAFLKFVFNLGRDGAALDKKIVFLVVQMLGLLQLLLGIWGMATTFPNTKYLGEAEGCPFNVYLSGFIPSAIIAAVIVGLLAFGAYYGLTGGFNKQAAEPVEEQSQEQASEQPTDQEMGAINA